MLRTKNLVLSLAFLFIAHLTFGQGQGNTPYSQFGYGELNETSSTSQAMMGGTGASFSNAFYVNLINPALLVKNRVASGYKYVAYNVEVKGNSRTISTNNKSQYDLGLNLNHISIAVPLTANWAMAAVLRPYSMLDYTTSYVKTIEGTNELEDITHTDYYHGGISRISYLNSFRLFKNLYLGAEVAYNFGTIHKDSTNFLFRNITNQLRDNTRYSVNGVSLKLGAAYQQKISDRWRVNLGASAELSSHLGGEELRTYGSYADLGNGPVLVSNPDTIQHNDIDANTPAQYRVGISLESPFHWVFAADYHTTKWEGHKSIDKFSEQFYRDTEEFKFGIEWLPNSSSSIYYNQIFYRVGFSTAKTPYLINGIRIKDSKFTMGLSLPLGFRNPSYINFSAAFGQRGVHDNNLIKEKYVRFSVSTSLLSPWFIKPRID